VRSLSQSVLRNLWEILGYQNASPIHFPASRFLLFNRKQSRRIAIGNIVRNFFR
jgi:hypothetical protein